MREYGGVEGQLVQDEVLNYGDPSVEVLADEGEDVHESIVDAAGSRVSK